MKDASATETLHVKLLSIAQQRHAPTTASDGQIAVVPVLLG
jgi:hypothetical protein